MPVASVTLTVYVYKAHWNYPSDFKLCMLNPVIKHKVESVDTLNLIFWEIDSCEIRQKMISETTL